MRRRAYLLAAFLASVLLQAAAPAAAQSFTDRAEFDAAAAAETECIDFETLDEGSQSAILDYVGLRIRSTDGTNGDLLVLGPDSFQDPALPSRAVLQNRNFGPLILEFDPPVNAVGLDVLTLDPSGRVPSTGVVVTVESSGGTQTFPIALTAGGPAFFGLLSGHQTINRVTVANAEGQSRYAGVDNVCYGNVPTGDPRLACLDRLAAAITEGRGDRTIRRGGRSLAAKVRVARAAVLRGKTKTATKALMAFKREVHAASRKRITPARAAQLQGLADECLALLRR